MPPLRLRYSIRLNNFLSMLTFIFLTFYLIFPHLSHPLLHPLLLCRCLCSYVIDGKVFVATVEVNDNHSKGNSSSAAFHNHASPFSRSSSPHSASRQATPPARDDADDIPPYTAAEPLSEDLVEALFAALDAAMAAGDVAQVLGSIRALQAQRRDDIDEGLACVKRRLERLLHCGA